MDLALIVLALAIVAAALIIGFALKRTAPPQTPALDPRLDAVLKGQGEIEGRFKQTLDQIAALEKTMGDTLTNSAEKTGQTLGAIGERLTVIDEAQKNISALSGQVTSLQAIFSDKQQRGAFGQERMEAIIADQLAPDQYEFQATLSNGSRPDCAIRIPNTVARIVVDSKFPLEAFEAMRVASSEDERKLASARLRADMGKHIKDIIDKYLIPGETQNPAILFVPSESIYAELHMNFAELLQRARRSQVVIVSPHVFMLVIGTIQGLMRDAKMRKQAHEIQRSVGLLLRDVNLLGERIGRLRSHFDTTNKDIGEIEKSMRGIERHADRIGQVELSSNEGNVVQLERG